MGILLGIVTTVLLILAFVILLNDKKPSIYKAAGLAAAFFALNICLYLAAAPIL